MEEVRGRGHPRSFKDENEFQEVFNNYIDHCVKNEYLPNIAGFSVFADINRETFYEQEKYYSNTFKRIQGILEDKVINAKINDTFKIFYLKNKFNYKDRTEIDQNVDASIKVKFSNEVEELGK
jgi:predicted acyltransferase (DUF342 family)